MTDTTYYIRLIGVNAKEEKLIKSFLSIAREDGLIVEIDYEKQHTPTTVFVDELFHSDSLVDEFPKSTVLILGDDHHYKADDYLNRPLKWSLFQEILSTFIIAPTEKEKSTSKKESPEVVENISSVVNAAAAELSEFESTEFEASVSAFASPSEFEASAFEITEYSEMDTASRLSNSSEMGTVIEDGAEIVQLAHSRVVAERALFEGGGLVLGPNVVFWENFDCLMTVKSRPVLYILSSTGSVYSEYGYLDWSLLLKSKYARVYPLPKDWSAEEKLTKYPLSWLVWFSSVARSKGHLLKSITKDGVFLLNEWPEFDQLYSNNDHLRLCSLLSTAPYSLIEISTKTRLDSEVIVGFLNACEKQGLLKSFPNKKEALKSHGHLLPPVAENAS